MASANIGRVQFKRTGAFNIVSKQKPTDDMEGSGVIQDAANAFKSLAMGYSTELGNKIRNAIPASDDTARPAYVGENHAILRLENGKHGIGNYMGNGTRVVERLRRGDPPRTQADKVAMRHDIDYTLAATQPTRELQMELIRDADNRMIKKLGEIKDSKQNIALGKLIAVKTKAEDMGLLDRGRFAGQLKQLSPEDRNLLESAKCLNLL